MKTYLLNVIDSDTAQLLNSTVPSEEFVWKGKTRLEDIGLRAFFLAGKRYHSESRHRGGEIDTIFYHPCKVIATQVRKPFRGCYIGSTTAIKILEQGMKSIAKGKTKPDYELEIQTKRLETNELTSFLEGFLTTELCAYDFHIYDILNYFEVPYKKPNIKLFIENAKQRGIEPDLIDFMRASLSREFEGKGNERN